MKAPLILFGLVLGINCAAWSASKFKKISVTETNNAPYFLYSGEGVFTKRDLAYLGELKRYAEEHGFRPSEKGDEVEFAIATLKWVSAQWDHDGMNEPAKGAKGLEVLKDVYEKKTKYRCVEYGLVLSDLLQAYGFVTRSIALRSPDVSYGKLGSGHVAAEVWINSLNKWIFLDAQFGLYLSTSGSQTPLNYFEIFQEKKEGRWDQLELHSLKPSATLAQDAKEYKTFLSNYFGYMSVSDGALGSPRISLFLESRKPSYTFQGMPLDNAIFTDDVKMVYPEMNRVAVVLRYKSSAPDFKKTFEKLKIDSEQDYMSHMAAFAPVPEFIAAFQTTEPFFDHYDYRIDSGKWMSANHDEADWIVKGASGRLQVRAVNKFGRPGPVTFIALTYE